MPIQFDYTTPATGAVASYHRVTLVTLDYDADTIHVAVSSYVSKDAYTAGKFSVYQQTIQIAGTVDAAVKSTVESNLVAAAPTDGTASNLPNRYLFAGATLVD